jgi:hypothetical protein
MYRCSQSDSYTDGVMYNDVSIRIAMYTHTVAVTGMHTLRYTFALLWMHTVSKFF